MKKLILLLFIPLVFACSDDSNSTNEVELQIGDYTVVAPFEADEETESEQVDTSETKDVPTGVEVC